MEPAPSRTPLAQLLAGLTPAGAGYTSAIPDDWRQGRAVYGGLSAALCLQAALHRVPESPPLRSAQLTFIGPAGPSVALQPTIARQGKSTLFMAVDLTSEDALAARAMFCFGKARESRLAENELAAPAVAPPAQCESFFARGDGIHQTPNFARHFDSRHAAGALPVTGAEHADLSVWLRLADGEVEPPVVGLAALADALPPAAMTRFEEPAPVSTMTWMFDMLDGEPRTENGWWLCRSRARASREGYSSQTMTIWNTAGQPVVTGHQNVAVFY